MPYNHTGNPPLLRWLPALLWMAVIFALSGNSDPYRVLPSQWESQCASMLGEGTQLAGTLCRNDTIGDLSHLLEYALLGVLLCIAILPTSPKGWYAAGGTGALYALSDEIHQVFVPGRMAQLTDFVRDAVGILLGMLLFRLLRRNHD